MSPVLIHVAALVVALILVAVVFYLMSQPAIPRIFTRQFEAENARTMRAEERRAFWMFWFLLAALYVAVRLCAQIISQ